MPTTDRAEPNTSPSCQAAVYVVEPTVGLRGLDLQELWQYRELAWVLAVRDFKLRYRQTILGVAWAIAPPLVTAYAVQVLVAALTSGQTRTMSGVAYGLSAYCGMLPWQLFSRIVGGGSSSLVANRHVITKIYFPRLLLPLTPVAVSLVDFLFGATTLIALLVLNGHPPTWRLLALPLLVAATVTTALSVTLWLAALNALYRDIQNALPFALQVLLLASPVLYAHDAVESALTGWASVAYGLNPIAILIDSFRWCLLGASSLSPTRACGAAAVVVVFLGGGVLFFRRMERLITDVV